MIRIAVLALCCLFSTAVWGDVDESRPAKPDTADYLNYYRAIAGAEEAMVNADYADAVRLYRGTFNDYRYNNPIDCYVAAQVAAYSGDTASCTDFLYRGLRYGLPVQTITGNPHLKGCFQKMAPQNVDSCRNIYRQSIDQTARAKMLSLIRYDQSIIHSLPKGENIYDYSAHSKGLTSRYRPIWDSLVAELATLIRTRGFPAQRIIGTQNGEDSLFRIGPNAVFAVYLFIHHTNGWPLVQDMMRAELSKGNITPQMYGVIYETSNGKRDYSNAIVYFASRPCWQRACKTLVRHHLREINEARWSIGLCRYEVMEKKEESGMRYRKWCSKAMKAKEPFFDFQCDLGFQGIGSWTVGAH